ncbi:MAG: hypothetical protein RBU25_13660, partial [Lentisphaeria bacterium]|nr:hypothetical protein [Lentisphaeria bacterium]
MMKRINSRLSALRALALLPALGLLGLSGIARLGAQEAAGPVISEQAAKDAAGNGQTSLQDLESLFGGAAAAPAAEKAGVQVSEDVKRDVEAATAAPAAAPAEAAPAQPAEPIVEPTDVELDASLKIQKQELEIVADEAVVQGNRFYRQGDYAEAAKLYAEAKNRLDLVSKSSPRILKKKESIDVMLHNLYRDWAYELVDLARRDVSTENVDSAIERLNRAREFDPSKSEEIDALIRKYQDVKENLALREVTRPDRVDPDLVQRVYDVTILLEQGKVFLKNRRYADARDKFEQVLLIDPYDVRAIRLLRQVNEELSQVAKEKLEATLAERMAEVEWRWAEQVTPLLAGPAATVGGSPVDKGSQDLRGIRKKLQENIFPDVKFEEIPLDEVLR